MTDDADPRPYGRRAFLALLAGGASSFLWAPAASNFLSPLTSAFSQALGNILPVGGWRIYTISGSMPVFDPKAWRLRDRRARPQAGQHQLRAAARVAARPPGVDVPLRHRLDGQGRALVRRAPQAHPRARRPTARGEGDQVLVGRGALQRLAHTRAGAAPRRDARRSTLDGQPLSRPHGAPARIVIPEMYGYKGVKWLNKMELLADAADRLLGRARLRPERLGREVEWLPLSASVLRASRAPSGPCIGCTRPRS